MQSRHLLQQALQFSLVRLLLGLQLGSSASQILPHPRKLPLLSPRPDLDLGPQAIDQLAQLRVLVEQLRVLLEKDLQLCPQIAMTRALLLVQKRRIDCRRLLRKSGVSREGGIAVGAFLGAEGRTERTTIVRHYLYPLRKGGINYIRPS